MTNDHGKKTVTHKRDNPVARVSIDLVLLMGKTVKEEGRGRRVGRHKKERVEERRTIKDREQTDTHWKSALGRDTSNAGVYGPCPCRRIVKLMYSWDNYFLHSLRGCKVFIGPEPGPAKHEAPLQSRSSDDGPPPPLLVPPSLPPPLSSSVYDTHLRTILQWTRIVSINRKRFIVEREYLSKSPLKAFFNI